MSLGVSIVSITTDIFCSISTAIAAIRAPGPCIAGGRAGPPALGHHLTPTTQTLRV